MVKNKSNLIILILVIIIVVLIVASVKLINSNDKTLNDSNDIIVKSKILKDLIDNEWNADYNYGDKESTFDEYDIYFNEGIEVKNINNKVFNIVFTEKYNKNILSNIKSTTSLSDIIAKLGQPDFGGKSINLIGYKLEGFYIFFNGKQASIYRIEDVNQNLGTIFSSKYSTQKEFIDSLSNEWEDYDIYIDNSNDDSISYSLINYTFRGIRISTINDNIEIIVYNNCKIKIPENDIYTVKTKNKNLVYEIETERQNSIHNREYAYAQYNASVNNLPPDIEDYITEEPEFQNLQSKKFIAAQMNFKTTGEYRLMFINIDGELPNSEIDTYVNFNVWLDDYNVIYSIMNKGIYLYNTKTFEKTIIKEGTADFIIHGITKDNILKYDDSEIEINI